MAVAAALKECEAQGIPKKLGTLWPTLKAVIERDPTQALEALQISDDKIREAQVDMAKPIGFDPKPMGFQEVDANTKTYLCVGFVQPTAVESLSELWECIGNKVLISSSIGPRIGPRLMCNKPKRLAVAHEALGQVVA